MCVCVCVLTPCCCRTHLHYTVSSHQKKKKNLQSNAFEINTLEDQRQSSPKCVGIYNLPITAHAYIQIPAEAPVSAGTSYTLGKIRNMRR